MTSKAEKSEDDALARFRKICLAFPETTETGSWGHPNFRVGKRTFAAFEWIKGRPSFAFNLGADDGAQLSLQGDLYFTTPYGRGQWTSMWVDGSIDWHMVEELVERSYRKQVTAR